MGARERKFWYVNLVSKLRLIRASFSGLTDKAAHDLYAIYQQTQNEETVKNTIAQDDRTTAVDEPESSFILTNPPTTSVFTTTTTTTTTTTPAPTTTTTTAAPVPSPLPGRGRFRGNVGTRTRHTTSTTETNVAVSPADATSETSERPKSRFRPSHHREPGQRVSVILLHWLNARTFYYSRTNQ